MSTSAANAPAVRPDAAIAFRTRAATVARSAASESDLARFTARPESRAVARSSPVATYCSTRRETSPQSRRRSSAKSIVNRPRDRIRCTPRVPRTARWSPCRRRRRRHFDNSPPSRRPAQAQRELRAGVDHNSEHGKRCLGSWVRRQMTSDLITGTPVSRVPKGGRIADRGGASCGLYRQFSKNRFKYYSQECI